MAEFCEAPLGETLTLEEFIKQHDDDINDSNEACQKAYEDRLKQKLGQWASTVEEESSECESSDTHHEGRLWKKACKVISDALHVQRAFKAAKLINEESLAADLLTGATTLDEVTEDLPSSQKEALRSSVYNVVEEFQGLFEEAFLLLNAPRSSADKGLPYHHEKEAREIQLNSFYNDVVGAKCKEKYPSMSLIIDTYEDAYYAVQCFIRCQASKSKRATVVFNGHGKSTGHLSLEREHNPPSNSTLLEDIYQLWDQNRDKCEENDLLLPSKITVVFAQCYGFLYTQKAEHSHVIDVVSLASPRKPRTKYRFDMGVSEHSNANFVEKSVHVELSEYARQRSDDSSGYGSEVNSSRSSLTNDDGDVPQSPGGTSPELFVPSLFLSMALPTHDEQRTDEVKGRREVKRSQSDSKTVLTKCHRLSHSWRKSSDASSSLISAWNRMSLEKDAKDGTAPSRTKGKFKFPFRKKKEQPVSVLDTLVRSTLGKLAPQESIRDSSPK